MKSLRLSLKETPPAYVPPSRTRGASTASFSSSLEDIDLEKGGSLLLTTPSSSAFAKSPSDVSNFGPQPSPMTQISDDSDLTIAAVDSDQVSEPSTPRTVTQPGFPIPQPESRPFGPPSVEPVSSTGALNVENTIHVTVHRSVQMS